MKRINFSPGHNSTQVKNFGIGMLDIGSARCDGGTTHGGRRHATHDSVGAQIVAMAGITKQLGSTAT